jgi:hypothetical protein
MRTFNRTAMMDMMMCMPMCMCMNFRAHGSSGIVSI